MKRLDLSGYDLSRYDLSEANLRYADLSYADLSGADLRSADLRYSDLSYANLNYTNLRYADLSYADLSESFFYNTNLDSVEGIKIVGFNNVGEHNRTTYYFYSIDRVICGCFDGTLEEFKRAVDEKYNGEGDYYNVIKFFEMYKE